MKHLFNWNKPRVITPMNTSLPWIQLGVIILITFCSIILGFAPIIADTNIQGSLIIGGQKNLWLSITFFLLIATFVPLANWTASRYGQKLIFFLGTVLLLVPSIFCGLTTNYYLFMLFRSLSAIGAGAVFPTSLTIIDLAFAPKEKTIAIALYVAISFGFGTIAGIFLGGYYAEFYHWQLIFLMIAIPTPIALFAVWILFSETEKQRENVFDYLGTLFYLVMIGSLVTGLSNAKQPWTTEGFRSTLFITSTALFVLSLYGFIWRETTTSKPLMKISLFKIRPFFLSNIAIFIVASTLFSTTSTLTKIFEYDLLYSKYHIALLQLPIGLTLGIFGAASGLLSKKIGIRILASTGIVLVAISCLINHNITIQSDHKQFLWVQTLRGIGIGMALGPFTALALKRITPENVGQAAVIITICRQFGGALGSTIVELVHNIRFPFHLLRFGEQMSLNSPALTHHLEAADTFLISNSGSIPSVIPEVTEGFTEAASVRSMAQLYNYAAAQADILAFNDAYWIIGWAALAIFFIIGFFMLRAKLHESRSSY